MMSYQPDFDDLAARLQRLATTDGYSTHRVMAGPLALELRVDPRCADLGFHQAFTVATGAWQGARDADFTVYIIEAPPATTAAALRPFMADAATSLVDLSDPGRVEQCALYDGQRRLLKTVDMQNRVGVLVCFDRSLLPTWEIFSPIKEFIHLLAVNRGCLLFHGATVIPQAAENHATLLVGPGGSGKSSLTAYALQQGMLTNGDDYVLVDLTDDQPVCWSVYRTFKLHPTSPVRPGAKQHFWRTDPFSEKSVLLGQRADQGGALTIRSQLSRMCGLTLAAVGEVEPNASSRKASNPHRHPYLHSCMSTVQQMPYRMDATLRLSRQLHDRVPYSAHTMRRGVEGLHDALTFLQGGKV